MQHGNSLLVSSLRDITSSEMFASGHIAIQDASASMAAYLSQAKPGMKVIDLCSAPGGKAFYVAELMKNEGSIIALDNRAWAIIEESKATMHRFSLFILSIAYRSDHTSNRKWFAVQVIALATDFASEGSPNAQLVTLRGNISITQRLRHATHAQRARLVQDISGITGGSCANVVTNVE